ncbi:MAG: IS1634 family transposase [Proteobacteria bacterium]|nr:IS1634 family transposase [Pseudomonadota bacterium]
MYIRRTKTRSTVQGKSYYSHRLVRSERVGTKVRQRTLLNLGRHFEVAQEHWPLLCVRLDQMLSPQPGLLPVELPDSVEHKAQEILARLVASEPTPSGQTPGTAEADIQSVDVNSLELVRPRSVGVEHVALWAMEQLRLETLLADLGLNGPQRAAALGLIIGRMAAPGSELATHRWLRQTSALGELIDFDYTKMSLMQLYRTSDRLIRHRERIEKALFNRTVDLFGLDCTITLYDLTNTYFEGDLGSNPKARRGHSKEKRSDCPLLTLGLMLDGSGFVRRSEIFAGNIFEGKTLQSMLKALQAPKGALVVLDRGIATEENLTWMQEAGYRYLVVNRGREREAVPDDCITINTANDEKVQLKKVCSEDGKEVRLYCYSERRARKEEGIAKRFMERFEANLDKLSAGLSRPRTTKRPDKLWERIGRLKEKSHGVSQHYHIELILAEDEKTARALRWERKPVTGTLVTHPGVYTLRSNETDWDEERMWRTYIMLTDLEAVFRSLKSELGLRPIYHHKEERADGHLFITVLAYQLVQFIRCTLREKDINDSWLGLRQTLNNQCRITATFRRTDNRTLHVRKASKAEPNQLRIYNALGINPAPGGINKLIV